MCWREGVPATPVSFDDKQTKMEQSKASFPCCIPASPNWYCSNVGDASKFGIFLFGGRNSVYKVDLQCQVRCVGAVVSHAKKVTSVCLVDLGAMATEERKAKDTALDEEVLGASGSEDGTVKIWGLASQHTIKEHKEHKTLVTSVASDGSQCLLFSGDAKGFIIIWNFRDNIFSRWCPVQSSVVQISLCPHDSMLTCIGYTNGHILLCNPVKQQIHKVYKSHSDEICCIAWCPDRTGNLTPWSEEKRAKGYLFASSSKDKTIKIWDSSSERPLMSLGIPTKARKGRRDDQDKGRVWISLCWTQTSQLLSGSTSGDVLEWNLVAKKATPFAANIHSRLVFSISHDSKTDSLITTSMDRQINILSATSFSLKCTLPSLGGFVYCMASSSMDPYALAYGVGDNMIRVWHTGQEKAPYKTVGYWQGIKGKVTAIAFNPRKEGILGFGLSDGRVGVYNTATSKVQLSASSHQKTVYSLSFGPDLQSKGDMSPSKVYSCGGEGVILIQSLAGLENQAIDFNTFLQKGQHFKGDLPLRSEVCWHDNMELVGIGNDNGSIEVFQAPGLKQIAVIPSHKKIINCLRWYPSLAASSDDATCKFWLASGSNDNKVFISDVSDCIDSDVRTVTPLREFVLNSGRITCLDWSLHSPGHLVFGSYDCTVQVWDAVRDVPLANFRQHQCRVLCVLWSPLNDDVIYSGDEEFNVHRWRVSEQPFKIPPERLEGKEKEGKKHAKHKTPNTAGTEAATPSVLLIDAMAEQKNPMTGCRATIPDGTAPKLFDPRAKETLGARKKVKSMLPLCAVADQRDKATAQRECVLLASHLYEELSEDDRESGLEGSIGLHANLALFSDWMDTLKVLEAEGKNHKENGNFDQAIQLQLWQSNVSEAVKLALSEGHLNDFIVSLSPMAGLHVWKDVAVKYAEVLASRGLYHQAASYYVAAEKPKVAIAMFKEKGMFREAIVLAKVRLPPDDPTVNELYSTWATKLWADGSAEQAANCYLALGQTAEAIHALAKKGDASSLETAAKVAEKSGNQDLQKLYSEKCVLVFARNCNWKEGHRVLDTLLQPMVLRLFLLVSEGLWLTLHQFLREPSSTCELNRSGMWNALWPCDGIDAEAINGFCLTGRSFVVEVISVWANLQGINQLDELRGCPSFLETFEESMRVTTYSKERNSEELIVSSSRKFTTGLLHLLDGNVDLFLAQCLAIISSFHEMAEHNVVIAFSSLIFPRNSLTMQEYMKCFGKGDDNATQQDSAVLLRNFEAYIVSSRMNMVASAQDELPSESKLALPRDKKQSCDCVVHHRPWIDADIIHSLPYSSFLLLSSWHYEHDRIRGEIAELQRLVKEAEFAKEVAQRGLQSAPRRQVSSKDSCLFEEPKQTPQSLNQDEGGTGNKQPVEPSPDLEDSNGPLNFRTMYEQCVAKAEDALSNLGRSKENLSHIPSYIKAYPFPDTRKSIDTIRTLLKRLVKGTDHVELSRLLQDVESFESLGRPK